MSSSLERAQFLLLGARARASQNKCERVVAEVLRDVGAKAAELSMEEFRIWLAQYVQARKDFLGRIN